MPTSPGLDDPLRTTPPCARPSMLGVAGGVAAPEVSPPTDPRRLARAPDPATFAALS